MHALALWLLLAQTPAGFGADAPTLHRQLAAQVAAGYDESHGGFVLKSTPVESAIELALLEAGKGDHWLEHAERTLSWTHSLMDTLTGGYFNTGSLRDAESQTADKRADSNGRRLELLVMAWKATGNEAYRSDADRVVDWAERVLLDGRGGFVSAQIGDRELEPSSNGQILHGWLAYAAATHDPRRKRFALQSLDRVWEECWYEPLGLVRRNEMKDIAKEPQLSDQVEMGRAFVLAARLCERPEDTNRARLLGDLLLARYQEPKGGFRTQSMPSKAGSIRKASVKADENARAARFLCELSALTNDPRYREAAGRATAAFSKDITQHLDKANLEAADWALAVRASYDAGLPGRGDFVAEAEADATPKQRRVVRFKAVHR